MKTYHLDHERIPERIVHARGAGAFGTFKLFDSAEDVTSAGVLTDTFRTTPVFLRFSTVLGHEVAQILCVMCEDLPSNSTLRRAIGISWVTIFQSSSFKTPLSSRT